MLSSIKTFAAALLGTAVLIRAMPVTSPELAPRQAYEGCQIILAAPLGFNVSNIQLYNNAPPQVYLKSSNIYTNGVQIEPTNSPDNYFYAYNCSDSNPTIYDEGTSSVWEVFVASADDPTQCLTVDTEKTDGVHLTLDHCNSGYKYITSNQRFQLALNSFYFYHFLEFLGDNHAPYPTPYGDGNGIQAESPGYGFEPRGPFGNGTTIVHYNPNFKGDFNTTLAMNPHWKTNTTWSPTN